MKRILVLVLVVLVGANTLTLNFAEAAPAKGKKSIKKSAQKAASEVPAVVNETPKAVSDSVVQSTSMTNSFSKHTISVGAELGLVLSKSASFMWGALANYKVMPYASVGAFIYPILLNQEATVGSTTVKTSTAGALFGVEALFLADDFFLEGFSIGPKIGFSSATVTVSSALGGNMSVSATGVTLGLKAAYDYMLSGTDFSVGGELFGGYSSIKESLTGSSVSSFPVMLLVAGKYWL